MDEKRKDLNNKDNYPLPGDDSLRVSSDNLNSSTEQNKTDLPAQNISATANTPNNGHADLVGEFKDMVPGDLSSGASTTASSSIPSSSASANTTRPVGLFDDIEDPALAGVRMGADGFVLGAEDALPVAEGPFSSRFNTWMRVVAFAVVAIFLPDQISWAFNYNPAVLYGNKVAPIMAPVTGMDLLTPKQLSSMQVSNSVTDLLKQVSEILEKLNAKVKQKGLKP